MLLPSPTISFAATLLLASHPVLAQTAGRQYTVWSSVIFQRNGERSPEIVGTSPTVLTSTGANQAYSAGQFYRNRYISGGNNGTNGAGNSSAPLRGLSADILDEVQVYATSLDQQWNVATAQAWYQGFYPPFAPGSNTSTGGMIDLEDDVLSNGTYVTGPLNGYQYPYIHTAGALDPNFIYLGANYDCPAFGSAARAYTATPQFSVTQEEFDGLYDAIGGAVLGGVIPPAAWDYWNAYAIWDYLEYENAHNGTVAEILSGFRNVSSNTSYLTIMSWLASQQQFAQLANLTALNSYTGSSSLRTAQGSISTIAGNMLASKVLDQLSAAIMSNNEGQDDFKLNLLFADFYPLMSFFALANLPEVNGNFYGIPDFAASAAFELWSYTNSSNATFPTDTDELYVRFSFRNGTSDDDEFRSYPLFGRGPDSTDMSWSDFRTDMQKISIASADVVPEWCAECGATSLFCAAFNSSLAADGSQSLWSGRGSRRNDDNGMQPAVAGVIGAIIALAIAGILFGLAMLLGGVRVRRDGSKKRSELGGFKGGQKMASDQDLTIPKDGAIVGASVVDSPMSPTGGHERLGSWELKSAEAGRNLNLGLDGVQSARPSMEQRGDPFQDPNFVRPVQSREVV